MPAKKIVELFHGKNEISISFNSIENIACIQIIYTGKMHAESMLPDDWLVIANKNKIICTSLGNSEPELLFNYIGLIKIKGASVITKDLEIYNAKINVEGINTWDKIVSEYVYEDRLWESFSNTHSQETAIIRTSIVKNNLTANLNELFLKDGTSYQGLYHQHEDGHAMTGGKHEKDSKNLYRKDGLGRLHDLRKYKKNKNFVKSIKSRAEELFIPKTRADSKDIQDYKTFKITERKTKKGSKKLGPSGGSGGY